MRWQLIYDEVDWPDAECWWSKQCHSISVKLKWDVQLSHVFPCTSMEIAISSELLRIQLPVTYIFNQSIVISLYCCFLNQDLIQKSPICLKKPLFCKHLLQTSVTLFICFLQVRIKASKHCLHRDIIWRYLFLEYQYTHLMEWIHYLFKNFVIAIKLIPYN